MDLGMDVVVVVDMQTGLLDGVPKYELQGVIGRINALTSTVRRRSGAIIWIRHCGKPGGGFERGSAGWAFLPELDRRASDLVVDKTLNDTFAGTSLQQTLERLAPDRVPPTSVSIPRSARPSRTITTWSSLPMPIRSAIDLTSMRRA
jgi:nicotinamidase-related amidase